MINEASSSLSRNLQADTCHGVDAYIIYDPPSSKLSIYINLETFHVLEMPPWRIYSGSCQGMWHSSVLIVSTSCADRNLKPKLVVDYWKRHLADYLTVARLSRHVLFIGLGLVPRCQAFPHGVNSVIFSKSCACLLGIEQR